MKKLSPLLAAMILFIIFSCKNPENDLKLKEGDLLFQDLNCGPLCDAIEGVTEGVNGRDFSHCAIIVQDRDSLKVIEAIGSQVQLSSIHHFLARSGDTIECKNIVVARVKKEYRDQLSNAVQFAKAQVGMPYDHAFIMNNGSYYCSELLYEAFQNSNQGKPFFELSPMTFKDPNTNDFFPAWIDYYKELHIPIPENEPGLNPGSISRSNKLKIISPSEFNEVSMD